MVEEANLLDPVMSAALDRDDDENLLSSTTETTTTTITTGADENKGESSLVVPPVPAVLDGPDADNAYEETPMNPNGFFSDAND